MSNGVPSDTLERVISEFYKALRDAGIKVQTERLIALGEKDEPGFFSLDLKVNLYQSPPIYRVEVKVTPS